MALVSSATGVESSPIRCAVLKGIHDVQDKIEARPAFEDRTLGNHVAVAAIITGDQALAERLNLIENLSWDTTPSIPSPGMTLRDSDATVWFAFGRRSALSGWSTSTLVLIVGWLILGR